MQVLIKQEQEPVELQLSLWQAITRQWEPEYGQL